jgi:uncharacterized protein
MLKKETFMGRKRCCGRIDKLPGCRRFKAEDGHDEQYIVLNIEELEALRLVDVLDMSQEEAADYMDLSRPTFQRILVSARKKTAQALCEGLTMEIQGGHYRMSQRIFECVSCKHQWQEAPCTEGGAHGHELACPKCGSKEKFKVEGGQKHRCGGVQPQAGHHHHGGCGCGKHS